MTEIQKPYHFIIDFVTGESVPDVGCEANRQAVEHFLVEKKGFARQDIEVDADLKVCIAGEPYHSQVDLVVSVAGRRMMAIKCAAASLGSREREIVAAARLLDRHMIPLAVASDGNTAIVLDTFSGKKLGEGLDAIPSRREVQAKFGSLPQRQMPPPRLEREKLIFRSYDSMNVNVQRNIRS